MEITELIVLSQQGDKSATEQIIKENSRLVWSVVKRFMGRGYDSEDLFQIGCIGLLKCIEKFDLSYEVKFSTYAVPMIMGEIRRFLRDDGMIKVSRGLKELATKAKHIADDITQRTGEAPTVKELAKAISVEEDELVMALEAVNEVESIYATVYQNDNNSVYLIDKLEQSSCETELIDSILLKQAIGKLSSRERQVIMMRYFDDKTQTEVANIIGISQVQVSRIEKKVLRSIKDNII